MSALKLFVVAALLGACSGSRIAGGNPTTIETYPGIVIMESSLVTDWRHLCGASILNELFVVTSGLCIAAVNWLPQYYRIRAGITHKTAGGIIINAQELILHPSYRADPPLSMDGDIGLIRLQAHLVFSSTIKPVAIVPQGYEVPDNSPVLYAGWGQLQEGGPETDLLHHVEVSSINSELCQTLYTDSDFQFPHHVVTENMICAGNLEEGGKGPCSGDQGGPLYFAGTLVGLYSFDISCADPQFPTVNTKVSSYTNWIVDTAVA